MVCCDVLGRNKECHETVYRVLASEKYHCLILVDGLDEWRIPENLRESLVHNFLPNIENVSNCTFLYTFRPWILASIANAIDDSDRLVQIEGLDERSREEVIGNVLEHHYGIGKTSTEFQQKKRTMVERSNSEIFKSLMDIPLLITASVILWSEGENVGNSMTSFYVSLVQLLIKRAKGTGVLSSDTIRKVEDGDSSDLKHPNLFRLKHNSTMKTFLGILSRLGKMAYTDLLSEETHLVFGKEELDEYLNESELDFALRTGILSQAEAPGTFDRENVSVSFFHTTIQEFLAAVHVVCQQDAGINSFLSELNATEKMLRLSNLIIFISGLSPTDGFILSRYISSAVSDDQEMIEYREDFTSSYHKAEMIYNIQVDCYRELHCESDEDVQSLQYHVQDVHIQTTNKTRTFFTSLILLKQFGELRSLFLKFVPWFMNERLETLLYDALQMFLMQSPSLEALAIEGHPQKWSIKAMSENLHLKTLSLRHVTVTHDTLDALRAVFKKYNTLRNLDLQSLRIDHSESEDEKENQSLVNFIQSLIGCGNLTTLRIDYRSLLGEDVKRKFVQILPELKMVESFIYTGAGYEYEGSKESMVKYASFQGNLKPTGEEIVQDLKLQSVTECSKTDYEAIKIQEEIEAVKGGQRRDGNMYMTNRIKPKELAQKQREFDSRVANAVACMTQIRFVKLSQINVDS